MAFTNSAPLSYAGGEVVKYVDAQRGVSEIAGGPKLTIVGLFDPNTNNVFDVSETASTANTNRLVANTTSQQMFPANASRKGMVLNNESGSISILLKYGSGANSTSYTYKVYPGYIFEMPKPIWKGNVHIIAVSSTADIQSTDLS
jgi:hypothetical protein